MQYENEVLADKSSCANIRADLKMCLLKSDCCKEVGILDIFKFPKVLITLFYSKRKLLENVYMSAMVLFQVNVKS